MGVGFGHTFTFDGETVEAWAIKPAWYEWDDLPDEESDLCCHYQSEALFELNQALQGELTLSMLGVDVAIPAKLESTYNGDDYCIVLDTNSHELAQQILNLQASSVPYEVQSILEDALSNAITRELFIDAYEEAIKAFALAHGFHYRKRIRGWCCTSYQGQTKQAKAA